jgi:hypothetical protein
MITRLTPFQKITNITPEESFLINWIWDSHNWLEEFAGYYKCKWCSKEHTSTMSISIDHKLCSQNPIIKKLSEKPIVSHTEKKGTLEIVEEDYYGIEVRSTSTSSHWGEEFRFFSKYNGARGVWRGDIEGAKKDGKSHMKLVIKIMERL